MAHLQPVLTDADTSNVALSQSKIRAIDANTVKLLNGDDGGTWAPSDPIVISGAGLAATGPCQITGSSVTTISVMSPLIHGREEVDDYVAIEDSAGQQRVLCASVQIANGPYGHVVQSDIGGAKTRMPGTRWLSHVRVHDGAHLDSVRLTWRANTHSGVPEVRPRFRLIRVSADGEPEHLGDPEEGGLDEEGFRTFGSNVSMSAYVNSNDPQIADYYTKSFFEAGAPISKVDLSRYMYFAEFVEESGANAFGPGAGNDYLIMYSVCTGINDMRPQ